MRWSELAGKDIINVDDASHLGRVANADLVLSEEGVILSLLTGVRGRRFGRPALTIPWERVVRVGPQAMLVSSMSGGSERPAHRPVPAAEATGAPLVRVVRRVNEGLNRDA